jgi:hypothetical protein
MTGRLGGVVALGEPLAKRRYQLLGGKPAAVLLVFNELRIQLREQWDVCRLSKALGRS